MKELKFDYDYSPDFDFIHIYSSDIEKGIKGSISIGDYTIDIGHNGEVVGIEIEEASKLLNMSKDNLRHLDGARLIVRKVGRLLFMGVAVVKNNQDKAVEFSVPASSLPLQVKY